MTKSQDTSMAQEWSITFQGSLAGTNVPQTTIDSTNVIVFFGSPMDIQATDTTGGVIDEVQTVTLSNASGGTFRLAFGGVITPPLDHDSTAAEVETALEALNTVDEVTVSGSAGGPWTVTFSGTHSGINVAKLNGDAANATNGTIDDGTYTYEYDDEGNRIRREKTSDGSSTDYEWDFRNRLIRVTDKISEETVTQVIEYTYDVFDRRLSRAYDTTSPFDLDDAVIESYVLDDVNGITSLDGGNVVLDFVDPEGQDSTVLARRYLFGQQVDQLLAQENIAESANSAERVFWPLVDHLQTVRDVYYNDASGATHLTYDAFGAVASGDTLLTRFMFTSREYDASTSLTYSRARWYSPSSGVWTTEDPLSFTSRDSSHHRYVNNIPNMLLDPSGLASGPWGPDFDIWLNANLCKSPPAIQVTPVPNKLFNNPLWNYLPYPNKAQILGPSVPVLTELTQIPAGVTKVGVQASQVYTINQMQANTIYGPTGTGPCIGLILYPKSTSPKTLPTYVFHLAPNANASAAFYQLPIAGNAYNAVLCGIKQTPMDAPLYLNSQTLQTVLNYLNGNSVNVVGYVPGEQVFVDSDGELYIDNTMTKHEYDDMIE